MQDTPSIQKSMYTDGDRENVMCGHLLHSIADRNKMKATNMQTSRNFVHIRSKLFSLCPPLKMIGL